jgi:hypothetical protein
MTIKKKGWCAGGEKLTWIMESAICAEELKQTKNAQIWVYFLVRPTTQKQKGTLLEKASISRTSNIGTPCEDRRRLRVTMKPIRASQRKPCVLFLEKLRGALGSGL